MFLTRHRANQETGFLFCDISVLLSVKMFQQWTKESSKCQKMCLFKVLGIKTVGGWGPNTGVLKNHCLSAFNVCQAAW